MSARVARRRPARRAAVVAAAVLLLLALGDKYAARVKSAEMLAVGWLEHKIPEELEAYRHVMQVAHLVIGQAFSNQVITPGKTTTDDVVNAWT